MVKYTSFSDKINKWIMSFPLLMVVDYLSPIYIWKKNTLLFFFFFKFIKKTKNQEEK